METETAEVAAKAAKAVKEFAPQLKSIENAWNNGFRNGLWAGRAEGALIVAGVGAVVFCAYCVYNLGVEDGRNTRNS